MQVHLCTKGLFGTEESYLYIQVILEIEVSVKTGFTENNDTADNNNNNNDARAMTT